MPLAHERFDEAASSILLLRADDCFSRSYTARVNSRDHRGVCARPFPLGAIAQLGERYNGIVEVTGSIPVGSTILINGLASAS